MLRMMRISESFLRWTMNSWDHVNQDMHFDKVIEVVFGESWNYELTLNLNIINHIFVLNTITPSRRDLRWSDKMYFWSVLGFFSEDSIRRLFHFLIIWRFLYQILIKLISSIPSGRFFMNPHPQHVLICGHLSMWFSICYIEEHIAWRLWFKLLFLQFEQEQVSRVSNSVGMEETECPNYSFLIPDVSEMNFRW